jgi:hypothetical protein
MVLVCIMLGKTAAAGLVSYLCPLYVTSKWCCFSQASLPLDQCIEWNVLCSGRQWAAHVQYVLLRPRAQCFKAMNLLLLMRTVGMLSDMQSRAITA